MAWGEDAGPGPVPGPRNQRARFNVTGLDGRRSPVRQLSPPTPCSSSLFRASLRLVALLTPPPGDLSVVHSTLGMCYHVAECKPCLSFVLRPAGIRTAVESTSSASTLLLQPSKRAGAHTGVHNEGATIFIAAPLVRRLFRKAAQSATSALQAAPLCILRAPLRTSNKRPPRPGSFPALW